MLHTCLCYGNIMQFLKSLVISKTLKSGNLFAGNKLLDVFLKNLRLVSDAVDDKHVSTVNQFQMFTCITQPFLEQWFQLAHVLKAQVEGFKAGDCGLTEVIAIQLPHSQANISLVER